MSPLHSPRLLFALHTLLAAASAWTAHAAPDSVVTFNEIHYHPQDPVPPATEATPEWVEVHNQMSIRVNVGGWSLRGGIDFTFPEGTIMEPGAFLVVSATAGTPPGALGPFSGKLNNAGEEIRLHERHGRMMDECTWSDSGAWPAAADGTGPSLAKRFPDDASGPAISWTASSQTGGTPGAANFSPAVETPPRTLFTTGSSWKIHPTDQDPGPEWFQPSGFSDADWTTGNAPFSTANPATPPQPVTVLPAGRSAWYFRKAFAWNGTLPNPYLLLTGTLKGTVECWFNGTLISSTTLPASQGLTVSAAGLRTGSNLIAIKLTPPPGTSGSALDLAASLIDGQTAVAPPLPAPLPGTVIVNELSYHAHPTYADPAAGIAFAENPAEWIELHNPGTQPVDLSNWRFSDAVDYLFPAGTNLAPGGFLVVSNTQFSGNLSNSGGRLRLRDHTDTIIDEVPWLDGGRWPEWADAGGSTLELIHPRADRRQPESWVASDETSRSACQTITYRATGAEPPGSNNPDTWREFLLGFLDTGEALVDDISVIEDPDGTRLQLIQNGTFESDALGATPAKWRLLGTHKNSRVIANPGGTGKVLHLVATGESDHTYNTGSTTLAGNRAINPARTYEISYKAKWLRGSPQLNSRLYLNRAARTTILAQPALAGTPGAANNSTAPVPGPMADGLRHSPLVPAAGQPVRISISLADPAGMGLVRVLYRVNQSAVWLETPMTDDGTGRYFAVIPGKNTSDQVQFWVEAKNLAGASTQFPQGGPDSRALYKVGDGGISTQMVRNKMRLLMYADDAAELHNPIHGVSNFRWPCTVIYNDREVWYDAKVRLRSAPFGRQGNRAGWNIQFNPARPFRGVQGSIVIDGAFNMPKGDGTGWIENTLGPSVNEMLYQTIANRAGGIPSSYDDVVYFQTPRTTEGNRRAQLKLSRFNNSYLEEIYKDGDDGTLFKQELIYYPTATVDGNPQSLKNGFSAVKDTEIKSFGTSKEGWRWNYLIQSNARRDDYSRLMALGEAFDAPTGTLYARTSAVMDTDNWTRVFALTALTGLADTYNNGLAHNLQLYVRPSDQKVLMLPWDQDHAFYYSPTSSIMGTGSHRFATILNFPPNRRLFAGHLRDLCRTAFTNTYLDPVISHLSSATVADKSTYAASLSSWVNARRAYVMGEITRLYPTVPFVITTNGGLPFTSSQTTATLAGNGWIDVRQILVSRNGSAAQSAPVTWLSTSSWNVTLPLTAGQNILTLTAIDHDGATVGTDDITITGTTAVEAAAVSNFAITEINYHPVGDAGEEFIEMRNTGTLPIDLTGVRFTEGVTFNFTGSAVTSLTPGSYVLVVRNLEAFQARYGTALPVAGIFEADTALANTGERLVLVDRADAVIASLEFTDQSPWPAGADGTGSTLTLIRPDLRPDPSSSGSWRPARVPGGSPGTDDALAAASWPDAVRYAFTALPTLTHGPDGQFILTWSERLGADDFRLTPEISTDLRQWIPDPGDGTGLQLQTETILDGSLTRSALLPPGNPTARFIRFRMTPR